MTPEQITSRNEKIRRTWNDPLKLALARKEGSKRSSEAAYRAYYREYLRRYRQKRKTKKAITP